EEDHDGRAAQGGQVAHHLLEPPRADRLLAAFRSHPQPGQDPHVDRMGIAIHGGVGDGDEGPGGQKKQQHGRQQAQLEADARDRFHGVASALTSWQGAAARPANMNTFCHAASLRSNDQDALAGLVDGSLNTGSPNAWVMRMWRADSPPLWAMARSVGTRRIRPARSLSWASVMALSRLPSRWQPA